MERRRMIHDQMKNSAENCLSNAGIAIVFLICIENAVDDFDP